MSEKIIKADYYDTMSKSYIDYSMSVITTRALPDARDGFKPVQRRILYAMNELGTTNDKPHRKSARIVGDTMGRFHPHGDASIYDALVVMGQNHKKNIPLIDAHGNFGSVEGDSAAAMRYTEARLGKFTEDAILKDLSRDTVDFVPNFEETEMEPSILPVKVPNLLLQGIDGIAVGMTSNIPPHNLSEVLECEMAYIDSLDKNLDSKMSVEEMMTYIKGPDWPTGGIIINQKDLLNIYETGTGKIKIRGEFLYEKEKKGKEKLIITSIPSTMVGSAFSKFLSDLSDLIRNKQLPEVTDIQNLSSNEGIRIVLELRKNSDIDKIKNVIYKKTKLEDTYSINFLAIKDKKPELLNLKQIMDCHVRFAIDWNTRKYNKLLESELHHNEIVEGNIQAIDVIDVIIEIVRGSKNRADAMKALMGDSSHVTFRTKDAAQAAAKLHFTELQANSILDMRLQRLIGLEILALEQEHKKIQNNIKRYQRILQSQTVMLNTIRKDIEDIYKTYPTDRQTVIVNQEAAVDIKEEILVMPAVFVMNKFGYAKLIDKSVYDKNTEIIQEENKYIIETSTADRIQIFTDIGIMYQIKTANIPNMKPKDKGVQLETLVKFRESREEIICLCSAQNGKDKIFITQKGLGKIVSADEFLTNNKMVAATKLNEGDKVLAVLETGFPYLTLISQNGFALRLEADEVQRAKKNALGSKVIKLADDDKISAALLSEANGTIIYHGRNVLINTIKVGKRGSIGTKKRNL